MPVQEHETDDPRAVRSLRLTFELWQLPQGRQVLVAHRETATAERRIGHWDCTPGHPLTTVITDAAVKLSTQLMDWFTGHGGV